jgi:hypothetical protein
VRGLDLALRVLQQYQQALTMGSVRAELEARLREELDYGLEARHMALYRDILRGEPAIAVPEPVPGLSTRRLLTMTWLEGEPILSRVGRASAERMDLAITMFRAWYVPFFEYGVLHGDPHLGNYTVRADEGRGDGRSVGPLAWDPRPATEVGPVRRGRSPWWSASFELVPRVARISSRPAATTPRVQADRPARTRSKPLQRRRRPWMDHPNNG